MSHAGMTATAAAFYGESLAAPDLKFKLRRPLFTSGLENPLLDTDSYKASHFLQYPPGTEYVYSYIEARKGGRFDKTLFFGLQAFVLQYLLTPITTAMVDEAAEVWAAHGEPFDRSIWDHIIEVHNGYLPVEIKALPEGMVVAAGTPLVTIVNTDPACFWLTSFLETALLRAIWYPTTVATLSFECKQQIKRAFDKTSDDVSGIDFKLHDFGARGVSSKESAALGGMAHLVNFKGTDTIVATMAARAYYNEPMAAFSVPAAEHSTITSWGQDREADAYANLLKQFGSGNIVSIVSDSYDLENAVENIFGGTLKQQVLDMNATLVVRPDSGDPAIVPVQIIEKLYQIFGGTVNSKGFKVLHPKVRVLQGDGINHESLNRILFNLEIKGFAVDNIVFGMGGGLLQLVNRDTCRFAMKASAIRIDGVWHDVFKNPKTDPTKASKRGRFIVPVEPGKVDVQQVDTGFDWQNLLQTVYKDGQIVREQTFADVRETANRYLDI